MKLLLICLFLSLSGYSQNNFLYILIDKNSSVDTLKAKEQNIEIEIFRLKSNANNVKTLLQMEGNKLKKRIVVKPGKTPLFEFIYQNNDNNFIKMIHKNDIINSLTYREIFQTEETNFRETVALFDTIYLINTSNYQECEYVIGKKVELLPQKGNL